MKTRTHAHAHTSKQASKQASEQRATNKSVTKHSAIQKKPLTKKSNKTLIRHRLHLPHLLLMQLHHPALLHAPIHEPLRHSPTGPLLQPGLTLAALLSQQRCAPGFDFSIVAVVGCGCSVEAGAPWGDGCGMTGRRGR